jgi:hypothetical protein
MKNIIINNFEFKYEDYFEMIEQDGTEYSVDIYTLRKKLSREDVSKWYDQTSKDCYATNFQMNPFEHNSFGKCIIDEKTVIIKPPKYKNGDSNWYSYYAGDEKRMLIIQIHVLDK